MNWSNDWGNSANTSWTNNPQAQANVITEAKPTNPWDSKSEDEVLLHWQSLQQQLLALKQAELDFRKYVVSRNFPKPTEGMNNKDLGNGYTLKASVKYNYKLAENDKVEDCLDRIAATGNEGRFIAERLMGWTPNFHVSEYRMLQEEAEKNNPTASTILGIVNEMLTIENAAPTLEIKAPRKK